MNKKRAPTKRLPARSKATPKAPSLAPCPIVGIGASAGGLDALKQFFGALPETLDLGLAFVVVQHLDPSHESLMAELLGRHAPLPVHLAEDGMVVATNEIYLIPPNRTLTLREGILRLSELVTHRGLRLTIDPFLRSLAEDQGARAIGVILTGTGSDGAAGIQAIKAHGGLTLAQDPTEAAHDGMPRSAIATGAVDQVLPVAEMPPFLQRYTRHPYLNGETGSVPNAEPVSDDLNTILALLQTRLRLDFRPYKPATLVRRIERRMGLNQSERLSDYIKRLREDEAELVRLGKDLMIGVTGFFRDLEAFDILDQQVLDALVARASPDSTLRVWVAGCASGEEAYTVAMLLLDRIQARNTSIRLQIFASDIDEAALEIARTGIYPAGSVAELSARRLQRYFTRRDDERFEVKKVLREAVVFAKQNLVSDPPFSKVDLITCRNLLIYFRTEIQEKLITLFHYALKPGGHLLLGSSESVANGSALFEPVSKKWRLYRCLDHLERRPSDIPLMLNDRVRGLPASVQTGLERRMPRLNEQAPQWIAEAFAPATVIVNRQFEALYFHGPVGRYLDLPPGEARLNLFDLLREGLAPRVRSAVHKAQQAQEGVEASHAWITRDGRQVPVAVRVQPVVAPRGESNTGLLLVAFNDRAERSDQRSNESNAPDENVFIRQLEDELNTTREDLQSTIEELETSNEELKASNEEVMSINEELQSTNEELETSKEELQSLNEELSTVNSQLRDKVEELEQAHNDITNLLNSSAVAILFLDSQFCIQRFNPATTELFHLIPSDVGRSLADITWSFSDPALHDDTQTVLDKLTTRDATVQNKEGRWFSRRIQPYRTQDNRIDGVVITFADISRLHASEQRARAQLAELEAVYQHAPVALAFYDKALHLVRANQRLAELHGQPVTALRGQRPQTFLPGPLAEHVEGLLLQAMEQGEAITDVEIHSALESEPGVARDWLASYYPVQDAEGETLGVNAVLQEITARKQAERRFALRDAIARALATAENSLQTDPLAVAMPAILDAFGAHFGADIGEFWEPTPDGQSLMCTVFRTPQVPALADEYKHIFDEMLLRPGEGLIGKVWAERTSKWFAEVTEHPSFARVAEAEALDLSTGFAFPVLMAGGPLGVVSVFTRERLPADESLQALLAELGRDIGNWVGRRRAEQRLRVAVEATGGALYEHRVPLDASTYHSPRWSAMLGYEPGALPPYHQFLDWLYKQVHPDDREALEQTYSAFIAGHTVNYEIELRLRHRQGHWVWVRAYSQAMARDDNGRVTRVAGLMFDISGQKRLEAQLRETDQRRSDFLSVLGHELRNPLASLSTAVQVLEVDQTRREWAFSTIHAGLEMMRRLLDDLLDLSRIERGKMVLRRERVSLGDILQRAMDTVHERISQKHQRLTSEVPELPILLLADPIRLEQVLVNLLINASKYTEPEGQIRLAVEQEGSQAMIRISDNGKGLASEVLDKIFEPFEQVHDQGQQNPGLGIGLTLVRQLVELHQGTVSAESAGVGRGATFTVQLSMVSDMEKTSGTPASIRSAPLEPGLRVLVVDDVEANVTGLSHILRHWGCNVETALDGASALARVHEQKPQVIILDLGLPDISGYELARQLRQEEHVDALLIALSGYGDAAAKREAHDAGFDHHLAKPADLDQLRSLLAQVDRPAERADGEGGD